MKIYHIHTKEVFLGFFFALKFAYLLVFCFGERFGKIFCFAISVHKNLLTFILLLLLKSEIFNSAFCNATAFTTAFSNVNSITSVNNLLYIHLFFKYLRNCFKWFSSKVPPENVQREINFFFNLVEKFSIFSFYNWKHF